MASVERWVLGDRARGARSIARGLSHQPRCRRHREGRRFVAVDASFGGHLQVTIHAHHAPVHVPVRAVIARPSLLAPLARSSTDPILHHLAVDTQRRQSHPSPLAIRNSHRAPTRRCATSRTRWLLTCASRAGPTRTGSPGRFWRERTGGRPDGWLDGWAAEWMDRRPGGL